MKKKKQCIVCKEKIKQYGKRFCSVECLFLQSLFRKKGKIRGRFRELTKGEILEIKIITKEKNYSLK